MPAALKPERARPPASVKVRNEGPSSRATFSTMPVSAQSFSQSQFWAWINSPVGAELGQNDDTGAAVDHGIAQARACHDLGAGIDQHDIVQIEAGTLGDTTHLIQIGGIEGRYTRYEGGDHRFGSADAQAGQAGRHKVDARPHALACRSRHACAPAGFRHAIHVDERKGGHAGCFSTKLLQAINAAGMPRP